MARLAGMPPDVAGERLPGPGLRGVAQVGGPGAGDVDDPGPVPVADAAGLPLLGASASAAPRPPSRYLRTHSSAVLGSTPSLAAMGAADSPPAFASSMRARSTRLAISVLVLAIPPGSSRSPSASSRHVVAAAMGCPFLSLLRSPHYLTGRGMRPIIYETLY